MPETVSVASGAALPPAVLGESTVTSTFSTSSSTAVDITGTSTAVTIGTRKVIVEFYCSLCNLSVSLGSVEIDLIDVTASAQVQRGIVTPPSLTQNGPALYVVSAQLSPAAGARTYKAQATVTGGGTVALTAGATFPMFLRVREV